MPRKNRIHPLTSCEAMRAMAGVFTADSEGLHNFGHKTLEGQPAIFSYNGTLTVLDIKREEMENHGVVMIMVSLPQDMMKDLHLKLSGIAEIELEKRFGEAYFKKEG